MKKTILVLVLMLSISLLSVIGVSAQYYEDGPDVEVALQRYEPQPAEPGTYTDVYLRVTNKVGLAQNLKVEFVEDYPFTLSDGESKVKSIGNLDALQDNYAVVEFKVNIDPGAINKDYNFTVYSFTGDGLNKIKQEFPLRVRGSDASVTLESYEFVPEEIKPGETAELTLHFKNTGSGPVKDLDVMLDFTNAEISTIGSGTTKRITRLVPNEKKDLTYKVIVDGSADVKVYDIPVNLEFRDYLNSQFNETTRLGLIVKAEPEVDVRLDQSTIKTADSTGDISIQVINSGIVDQRYVTLKLLPSSEYQSLSYSDEVYIGNLDSDDFEIADFKVKPNVAQPTLKFEVDFKDPYNKDFSKQFQVPLRIISDEELGKDQGSSMPRIIVGLLVIGGIFYYYRKRKKRKQAAMSHHKAIPAKTTTTKKSKRRR